MAKFTSPDMLAIHTYFPMGFSYRFMIPEIQLRFNKALLTNVRIQSCQHRVKIDSIGILLQNVHKHFQALAYYCMMSYVVLQCIYLVFNGGFLYALLTNSLMYN